jgi:phenylpropionate dioxygenase-like ring-hydroxylating dioxygenase large terminal subunit
MSTPLIRPDETDDLSNAPTGRAKISADRFISTGHMENEWEKIWPKTWLVAGVASDVREPGDYFVFNIGLESILVSRTKDGELAAMYNVCQHRGARVVVNDIGALDAFVCPYHGWTYDHGGKLIHAPETDRFSQGVPCEELSLKRVRVESLGAVIWVCMDDDVPPLNEFLGPIPEMIAPYRLDDMVLAVDQTVELDANWKAVIDNFGELYHVEHIHPQHALIFDCPGATVELMAGGHNRVLIEGFTVNSQLPIPDGPPDIQHLQMQGVGLDPEDYKGRPLDVRLDMQKAKREMGPKLGYNYDLLSDEQLSDIVQYNVFPNTIWAIQPEELWVMRSRPHETDPNKCYWDKFTFRMLPEETAEELANVSFSATDREVKPDNDDRIEHEYFSQDDVISGQYSMTITIDQDVHLIRDIQAGMHSRGFNACWLNDDEGRVQHFHDWIDHYIAQ